MFPLRSEALPDGPHGRKSLQERAANVCKKAVGVYILHQSSQPFPDHPLAVPELIWREGREEGHLEFSGGERDVHVHHVVPVFVIPVKR